MTSTEPTPMKQPNPPRLCSSSSSSSTKVSIKRVKFIIHQLGKDRLKSLLQFNQSLAAEANRNISAELRNSDQNQLPRNSLKPHVQFLQKLHFQHVPLENVDQHFSRLTTDGTFLMQRYESSIGNLTPTQVFSLNYDDDEQWYAQNEVQLAFHGTSFSNVLSILTTGLNPHVKNEGRKHLLHGKAVYLAKDLRVARDFSKRQLFQRSNDQSYVSAVFIVEYNTNHSRRAEDYIMLEKGNHCRVRGVLWYESKQQPWSKTQTLLLYGGMALILAAFALKHFFFSAKD